jgi:hypothetical protein
MPLLDAEVSAKMGNLEMMDDAIAYRLYRLNLPCPDCGPTTPCPEHASDEHLIADYQDRYAQALQDVLTGIDPDDIALIMQPGDDTPPTAGALSLVILARLQELAASGPAVTKLDGRSVVIELDDPVVIEHLLPAGTGDSDAA